MAPGDTIQVKDRSVTYLRTMTQEESAESHAVQKVDLADKGEAGAEKRNPDDGATPLSDETACVSGPAK